MSTDEREAFEKWAEENEWPFNASMDDAFDIWQAALAYQPRTPAERCEDCPPVGYPTDATRCDPCDRRTPARPAAASTMRFIVKDGVRCMVGCGKCDDDPALCAWHQQCQAEQPAAAKQETADVPEGWKLPTWEAGTQFHFGTSRSGKALWHSDTKGELWCGDTGNRTPAQLLQECESTVADLRKFFAAPPAPRAEGSES